MSGFSFASIFGAPKPAAAAAPAAPVVPANGNTPTTGAAAEATAPGAATSTVPANGLDLFAQLVQNNGTVAEGAQAPSFSIAPDQLTAAAAQLDFLRGAPEDAVSRIQAGDMTGLADLLQHVGRQGYQTAMSHSMALTNKFVGDRMTHEQSAIDQRIDTRLATSNIPTLEGLHPVAQGMFKETVSSLQKQYPQASQAQLQEQAWVMMEDLGKQFDRTGRAASAKAEAAAPNWDQYGGFSQD